MKRIAFALFLIPAICSATPFDMLISQRNIADTATFVRTTPLKQAGVTNLMVTDSFTNFPKLVTLGQPFGVFNDQLEVSIRWDQVLNAPVLSPVATSGDYNDLINKPSGYQVNSDWAASSGAAQILNKPTLSIVATSGAYSDLSGTPSIPAAQVNSDWSAASGISQVLNKPTTLAGYGISDAYPLTGNPSSFLTGITGSQVTTALGFTPYNATNPSAFVTQAGARSAISLTTTGTSGAATYNASTGALNIPSYAPSRSQSAASRSFNTAFQISATRDALASYSVQCVITASIAGGQSCDVILEIATDAAFTTGVQTVGIVGTGQTYTLAVALQGVQPQTAQLFGYVPAGYYARIRTVSVTGSPTFSMRGGQEVLQ